MRAFEPTHFLWRRGISTFNTQLDDGARGLSKPAIVMSAAASEAFVSEFAEQILKREDASTDSTMFLPPIIACAQILREMEEVRGTPGAKYQAASLATTGKTFDTGAQPFQDFRILIMLRNAIMHMEPRTDDAKHRGARLTDELATRN